MELEGWKQSIEKARKGSVLSATDRFGTPEIGVKPEELPAVVKALKGDPAMDIDMLIDLVAVDYSAYPDQEGPRFGLLYHFKSLTQGHRVTLKVLLEEEIQVGTISRLYKNADWLEREAWDQMGVRFKGHPNLKRLLNHHEFVGHPLRKDYPITKRQWLTTTDPMLDQVEARLKQKGWN